VLPLWNTSVGLGLLFRHSVYKRFTITVLASRFRVPPSTFARTQNADVIFYAALVLCNLLKSLGPLGQH